ncbi:MAG: RNA 2',3'-cyclic phosphodiesterase [Candidatus Aenigmarchaeota archaeon]|nr:RNA 2',3'-cyclic phosphodiesterase [Candidatus Aenigmarchaeota archaeon]
MRCFVAVDLDDALKPQTIKIQKELADLADLNLVESENLHFTLKFLGETTDAELEKAEEALTEASSGFKPFDVGVAGLGTFPNIRYVRIIWIGAAELFNLQKCVDEALAGLRPRERHIIPHLTLARVRSARGKEKLAAYIDRHADATAGTMVVKTIKLKQSTLTPEGPMYEDLNFFRLNA